MRILYLYQDIKAYRYDYWLREHFILQIPRYSSHKVFMYGPGTHERFKLYTPLKYDKEMSLQSVCDKIEPDVILIAQKSRMFMTYYPNRDNNITWLPSDFAFVKIPKIVIEEDYHYEKDDSWYVENNINLILQRHYSQSLRQQNVEMKWLPFSVDDSMFKPRDVVRYNKLCLTGSSCSGVYEYRTKAFQLLNAIGLADGFLNRQKIGLEYVKNLQEYISHISCGSIYNIVPAKCFEIMASGSVLFTNKFDGIEKLFPDDAYVSYDNKFIDVVEKANLILNDVNYRENIVKNAIKGISEKHSHLIRMKQLFEYLGSVVNAKL